MFHTILTMYEFQPSSPPTYENFFFFFFPGNLAYLEMQDWNSLTHQQQVR